jgi:hypothetical protein
MNLDRVTITGADDSVKIEELLMLSKEFPFVEWGILASSSNVGSPRFPSWGWMYQLRELAAATEPAMQLSLHLCGSWVRRILVGDLDQAVRELVGQHARVQLNFHAERNTCKPDEFASALKRLEPCQFIFQIDGAQGNSHMESLFLVSDIDAVPLFDISGGAGILPKTWPKPVNMRKSEYLYHGYAGGLGPDNLLEQLPLIGEAAGTARIWIDMETRVRSADDQVFDLVKVRRCLEIAKLFVRKS